MTGSKYFLNIVWAICDDFTVQFTLLTVMAPMAIFLSPSEAKPTNQSTRPLGLSPVRCPVLPPISTSLNPLHGLSLDQDEFHISDFFPVVVAAALRKQ